MKKFFAWFFGTLCVLAACLSCQDPLMPVDQPDSGTSAAKHFTATTESPATKTELSGNDTDGYVVNWQSDDKIKIVDAASTPNVGVYSTTSTAVKADFTFVSGAEATTAPYKAYYPETLYNNGTLTLPATQTYVAGNIGQSPMYAESNDESLKFKNLCGIVRLNITTNDSNRKVRKIVLSANQGMSGTFTISDNAAVIPSGTTAGVTLDCGTAGTAIGTSATAFYLAVPAASYSNLKITVVTTDGGKQTRTANKAIVVERSAMTDISLSFNGLEMDATDLSAKATANTYIVSNAGTYKFKATVKGNGGLDPVTGTTATPISTSDISGVTVLWELANRGQAIKYDNEYEVYYADGYVYFRTPDTFTAGDAYVAVFKDGNGGTAHVYDKEYDEVLWSWMIWSTDTPGVVEYGDITILDRNLGALGVGSVPYRGCAYEWGRKDPFPGCYNGSYTPSGYYPDRMTAFSIVNFDTEGMTVAYSIAHPTTYPYGWSQHYWQTASEYTPGMWWNGQKTIYDPCPAGWKVPSKDEMDIVRQSSASLPGGGFLGNCRGDFEYGNPGSCYYWTSTGLDRNHAWGWYGGSNFSTSHVDNYTRSGYTIRPVEDMSSLDLSGYTDLSSAATANCYIVPATGDYKFRATVKGNGAADLAGISKTTDAASIAGAALVWATYGTSTAPVSGEMIHRVGYKDGYVFFSTGDSFHKGNALVAIKDASNTILWSWHLWFTNDNIEGLKKTYPGGAVFMDRNLGALSNSFDPSCTVEFGMLYQWGRKDPFHNVVRRGSGYVSSNNYTTAYLPAVLGQSETGAGVVAGAAYSLATMISKPYEAHYEYYDGSSFDNNSWASGMTDDLWAASKTIFDPCPPGWKVPVTSDWDATFLSAFTENSIRYESITQYSYTSTYQVGVETAYGWFPSTGYHLTQAYWRNSGNTSYQEARGNGALEQNSGYHIRIWASDGILLRDEFAETAGVLNYTDFVPNGRKTVYRTNANSVRCVKE